MKPAEITREVLAGRIDKALGLKEASLIAPSGAELIATGAFDDLFGVVEKATQVERLRAGHVARRLGHPQTGRVIMDGST